MWLEVEHYLMQVKKKTHPCVSPQFNFCRDAFFETTKQEVWGMAALRNYIKHPNVE